MCYHVGNILKLTKNVFCFRSLDLSFNRLTKIENLGNLTRLRKLFLIHNKITKMENLDHLVNLEMLELGSNRIRVNTVFCLSRVVRKPVFRVSDQVHHKPCFTATKNSKRPEVSYLGSRGLVLSM